MAAILSRPQCVNWFNARARFTLGIPMSMKYKLFILEIRRRNLDHPWSVWKVYIYEICIEFVYIRGYFNIRLHVILIFVSYVYIYFIGVNVSSNKSHVNKSVFGNLLSMKYFSFISRVIVIIIRDGSMTKPCLPRVAAQPQMTLSFFKPYLSPMWRYCDVMTQLDQKKKKKKRLLLSPVSVLLSPFPSLPFVCSA